VIAEEIARLGFLQLLLDLHENRTLLRPLGLDRAEQIPQFARALLDGQCSKSDLQAVQERPERCGTFDDNSAFALSHRSPGHTSHTILAACLWLTVYVAALWAAAIANGLVLMPA
jgi:hypothetical protein